MVDKPLQVQICNYCFHAFVNKYFNVMINCFVKQTNYICGIQKGNMKAKKAMHL